MIKNLAIATSGGGMNCSYSAGALCALAEVHDIKEPEIVVGSSGSTGSLAYYITEQYSSIKNTWINLLTSKKFISLKRINKIMNIDYLIDVVFKKIEPLNYDKFIKSKIKFFIPATECQTGQKKFFHNYQKINIFEAMRASKAIPVFYGKKVNIEGVDYIDSSISAPLSENIEKALSEGAKNIIVIKNDKESPTLLHFLKLYSFFVNKNLKKSIKKYINQSFNPEKYTNSNMIIISPSKKIKIHMLDNKRSHLENSFNLGYNDVKNNNKLKSFLNSIG